MEVWLRTALPTEINSSSQRIRSVTAWQSNGQVERLSSARLPRPDYKLVKMRGRPEIDELGKHIRR
jgi:hypothetical protein